MPKRMIRTAPMSSSSPVVENKPTPDFAASVPRERLIKNAAIIANTQRITIMAMIPVRKGIMLSKLRFDMLGVNPESAVQSPFQSGKIVYRKSVSELRTTIATTAIEITPPTIPIINP